MIKLVTMAAFALTVAAPAFAASEKETDCGHQAAVVSAIQQARLDRVAERKVKETVLAGEVTWPERYNKAIPLFSAEIYKIKRGDLKKTDLAVQWKATCLAG